MEKALLSFVGSSGYEQMCFGSKQELRNYVARVISMRVVNGVVAYGWHWSSDYGWSRCRETEVYLR